MWVSCVCVFASCVWAGCMWVSCVWAGCMWVSCVCVCKLCVSKLCVGGGGGREADGKAAADGRQTGCRTKNKNPTQRCGEKGVIVHLFAGEKAKEWRRNPINGIEVITLDITEGRNQDLHNPGTWSFLWKLASLGKLLGIIGGPPCRRDIGRLWPYSLFLRFEVKKIGSQVTKCAWNPTPVTRKWCVPFVVACDPIRARSIIFEGSLAEKLRFWVSQLHFWRKSRRKASF